MSTATAAPLTVTVTMNPAIDVSASVDEIVPDHKLRCGPPSYEPGGGGINVARAIRRLGGDALALFPAGGPAGALLTSLLEAEGVRTRTVPIGGWTRENVNIAEGGSGRQFRFVMPGPSLVETEWGAVVRHLDMFDPAPAYLVVSGSLPPGVPLDFYGQLARWARSRGVRFVLDASGEPLRRAIGEGVAILKASVREFEELTGEHGCDESRLAQLARGMTDEKSCDVVVLSLGARGVLWMSPSDGGRLQAPVVPVKSSVGAGDSLVAGIVLSLARGHALPDALRLGVAAGAAAVMNPGTQLCRTEDVERLYAEVTPVPIVR